MMRALATALIALFIAVPLSGEEKTTIDTLLSRMEGSEKTMQGLRFVYKQDIIYNLTKEKQTNSGEVSFRRPNSLNIKQHNPLEQVIVTNGKKVWIYTPAYNQVIVDSWKKWSESSMVPSSLVNMSGNWSDLKKKYTFAYLGAENDLDVVLMTPKSKEDWKLKLWIERSHSIPVKSSMLADSVTIHTEMKEYTVNPELDKSLFEFRPPQGADVLTLP